MAEEKKVPASFATFVTRQASTVEALPMMLFDREEYRRNFAHYERAMTYTNTVRQTRAQAWDLAVREYERQGLDRKAAQKKVLKETLSSVAAEAATAFVMGMLITSGNIAVESLSDARLRYNVPFCARIDIEEARIRANRVIKSKETSRVATEY